MLTILWNQIAFPASKSGDAGGPVTHAKKFTDLKLEQLRRDDAEALELVAAWVTHSDLCQD